MTHPPRSRPKVLIVDDRPDNLLVLEAILEPLPCELVRAGSGQEALRRLLYDEVAVILLDVQMPGLDGYETARAVKGRERTRSIPIIFLTAIDRELDHQLRGYGTGAVDFLAKPLEPQVLLAKVSVFLDLHEQRALVEEQAAELARRLEERDAAQAALSRLTAELRRSNANLERFAVAIAHDLREPLQVGAGLLDLLADRYAAALGSDGCELLDEAREGLRELGGLVAKVLGARAAAEPLERRPVALDEALAEAKVQLAAQLADADPALTADPLPTVPGDAWSLQQVFVHVVQSALRRSDGPATIHVGVTRRDRSWVISTTDDGRAIDPAELPRLFSLFGRPGDPDDADDAGLAIARRTVEQHGGVIWVEPAPGKGTTVSFTLPADPVEGAGP